MKKLIIVGNKDIDNNNTCIIDKFDYVVRLNRMTNYGNTGFRTDLLLVDFHNEFFKLVEKPYNKYLDAKKLLLNTDVPFKQYLTGLKLGIITQKQLYTSIKVSLQEIANNLLGKQNWI